MKRKTDLGDVRAIRVICYDADTKMLVWLWRWRKGFRERFVKSVVYIGPNSSKTLSCGSFKHRIGR